MTRLATAAGFLAAVAWLVTKHGCQASLVPRSLLLLSSSSSSSSSSAEQKFLDDTGRPNLRPAAPSAASSSSSSAGVHQSTTTTTTPWKGSKQPEGSSSLNRKKNLDERAKQHRIQRHEAMDGAGPSEARLIKTLGEPLAMMTTQGSTTVVQDWSKQRQLGMTKRPSDQDPNTFHTKKEGKNKAARPRFLSKSHSQKKVKTLFSSSLDSAVVSSNPPTLTSTTATSSTSHISPSIASSNLRKTQESLALGACQTAAENQVYLSDTSTCTCSDDPVTMGRYILECVEPCTYCSEDKDGDDTTTNTNATTPTTTTPICAKASHQFFFEAETGANTARSWTYAYNSGRDETITILETDCSLNAYGFGNCTGCVASVDGTTCNSCSIQECNIPYYDDEYEYFSPVVDCTNVGSSAVYNFCDFPTIPADDPLYVLGTDDGFGHCANLGTAACEAEKVLREAESDTMFCHCEDPNDVDVLLICADNCGLLCNDKGDACGRPLEWVDFSTYLGSVMNTGERFEYRDGHRHELMIVPEGDFSGNCSYHFFDPDGGNTGDCECVVQTCADGTEAPRVDCTLTGGDVLDLCQSDPQLAGTMFVHRSFDNCIDFSPDNDACSDLKEPLAVDGSPILGTTRNAMYFDTPSCGTISDTVGLYYNVIGNNTGVRVSTCSNETNFDSQLSVYGGSCDALQCVASNDDSDNCGASSTVHFFGEQDVMYHVRVHGYDTQKGDFALTVEQLNIALLTCEDLGQYAAHSESGKVCECTEHGLDATLTCHDECSYCNTDKTTCATKTTASTITSAAFQQGATAKVSTYTYTKGLMMDDVVKFETTECDIGERCSACRVIYNDEECNSCTPSFNNEGGYNSIDVDCGNIDPHAIFTINGDPSNTSTMMASNGPFQVLLSYAFDTCVRDPLEVCHDIKAHFEEDGMLRCECTGSDAGATLTWTDSRCPMSCNSDYTVCWLDSFGVVFDANGQESSRIEINTYTEGRDEVVIWEGPASETCRMTVNGTACNSCGYITCPTTGYLQPAVDCENIEQGAFFDFCTDYFVQGQVGVLQAFNYYENNECLVIASAETACQQQVEQRLWEGFACDCALDPITGEDYLLTCVNDALCLFCNSETTVCANQSTGDTINKYGQVTSSFASYTYVSGGRDETVVLGNWASGGGEDCYITVNGTTCNSCGPSVCMDEFGNELEGVAVDCENIETGAIFDNCDEQYFFVDTGVLEVASTFEFQFCRGDDGKMTDPTPNDNAIP
jgi:hypothetical protein